MPASPSRKKAKGKARKKAKEEAAAKQAEEEAKKKANATEQPAPTRPTPTLRVDDVLREIASRKQCTHGFNVELLSHTSNIQNCGDFIDFFKGVYQQIGLDRGNPIDALNAARHATRTHPHLRSVWEDATKLEWIMSYFVTTGTKEILEGRVLNARHCGVLANHFEQSLEMKKGNQPEIIPAKMLELLVGDMNTLVKYFRQRIPCKCLDEKYEEVKSITKLGYCCNPTCSVPGRVVERKTMLYCTRCRQTNYCSRECQELHWPKHKDGCLKYTEEKAKLSAGKKKSS